jgi:hypothetical protein
VEKSDRRERIRRKLAEDILPLDGIERLWGGPAAGETCNGCDEVVPRGTLIMEGINPKGQAIQFHVECFYIWDQERRAREGDSAPQA